MFDNIKIRAGLTATACVFAALLMLVIGIGYTTLKHAMSGFQQAQRSTAAIEQLNASSQKLLQARLTLSSYEILFHVGKPTDGLLDEAQRLLAESKRDFDAYAQRPYVGEAERQLAASVADARAALVDQAIEPEYQALANGDFATFRTIQGDAAARSYRVYAKAIDALETLQSNAQRENAEILARRFKTSVLSFAGIGAVAIILCFTARALLTRALVKPMAAVERVTHIMSELEAAASEQRAGIEQVNGAIGQIDDFTQNNVALVEQAAAAAKSLEEQAAMLLEAVAVFHVA